MVAGQAIALHERGPLESLIDLDTHEVWVPSGTRSLEVAWLGSPGRAWANGTHELVSRAASVEFDALGFVLVSPSGQRFTITGDRTARAGIYRRLAVATPEPGAWTMQIDKRALAQDDWGLLDVGWLAALDHPDYLADAWIDREVAPRGEPVVIHANVSYGAFGVGGIQVEARVFTGPDESDEWIVPLFDDGTHADGAANDGVYAAEFVPSVAGPHSVRVEFTIPGSSAGSWAIPGEALFAEGPVAEPVPSLDRAVLIAHANVDVRDQAGVVQARLPELRRGAVHHDLHATVAGVFVPAASVSLGDGVSIRAVTVTPIDFDGTRTCRLSFEANVAADAPIGPRDLTIEVGSADYVALAATRVAG